MKRRRNILFISSDQHANRYLGCMGHPVVQTPNLDRIAREGVAFLNAYSGSPVCVPARACMMTGMYASDCNSFCNSTVWDGSHPTWAKRLKGAGYRIWGTGKMDLNDAFDTGFEPGAVKNGHCTNPDITSLFRRPMILRANERQQVDGTFRTKPHRDSEHAERCVEFLKNEVPHLNEPWVAYVGFHMPHPEFRGLKVYYDAYIENGFDLPQVPHDYLENLHPVYDALRHFKRIATPIPEDRVRRARAAYYAMISELDGYVGHLFDALIETGQMDNTLFVYTSDHGEALGENGLWLKNSLQEGVARVPLLMASAGLPRGVRVETAVSHVDLAATLLEFGRIGRPSNLRGHSLTALIDGRPGEHPGFAYSECHSEGNVTGSFMIRKGDWKYVHFTWYDGLLHNLREDPFERVNRIDDPECADVLNELQAVLWQQVNPEEVTDRAFRAQDRMLHELCAANSDPELLDILARRLGEGQARAMIAKLRGR